MKTPEQLAEEWIATIGFAYTPRPLESAFLAGYQAAKDQLQPQPFHAGADVYIIDANNPLPKPMPLSIAEQVQFADTGKVMNSPEKPDSCEHILDMKKMVDVNSSNNSNGWISVKERLPEDWDCVLWLAGTDGRFECGWEKNECANSACKTGCGQSFGAGAMFICEFHRKDKHYEQHYLIDDNNDIAFIDCFTHWMPLPEAPKGEK